MPAHAGFGKFDDVLVTIGEGAFDQIVLVLFARLDVLGEGRAAAEARIEPARRLPRVAQTRARRPIADLGDNAAERGEAGDAMNEDDRRQQIAGIRKMDPGEYFGKFREQRADVAINIDLFRDADARRGQRLDVSDCRDEP